MAKKATSASSESKPAAKSPKAPAKGKKAPAIAGAQSPIDTNLAAQAAARMLLAKATGALPTGNAPAAPRENSSTFKQMKDSLDKGHLSGIDNVLASTSDPAAKKIAPGSGLRNKQVGHNQTFGADVNRANIPRRTGG